MTANTMQDHPEMIGVCGDDCSDCPRYVATLAGSSEALERVKDLWVRLGFCGADIPTQDLRCHSCGPNNNCSYPEVRTCAADKGIGSCGQCHEYPCAKLEAIFQRTDRLKTRARQVCTAGEYAVLDQAFFRKRANLDRAH